MSLKVRLAAAFALVAAVTAIVVALAIPPIVGRGFSAIESGGTSPGGGQGRGPGPLAGMHAQQVQQETVQTLVVAAVLAAAGASLLGIVLARRLVEPLRQLEAGARAVAAGDLAHRSPVSVRRDEIGSLGRSFDSMSAALEREDSARRRFLQDAAHELKTPLAVIEATATAVLDGVYRHEDRHLETIRDQSQRLTRIVDELRTISLADAGALHLTLVEVDVPELVQREAEAVRSRVARLGVTVSTSVPDGLVVRADADRLRQALAALCDNALRYTPAGGEIAIAGEDRDGMVRLAVRDTGPGVAAADLPHVFERFYRADPARDRASGSSGLGLSIVAAIAAAHQGRVGAENGSAGGALFWIELPTG